MQHIQRLLKVYVPDGPISKEQCQIWVNYLKAVAIESPANLWIC